MNASGMNTVEGLSCIGCGDVAAIAEEAGSHLAALSSARVTVIEADVPASAPESVIHSVTDNGHTLTSSSKEFEEE